MVTQSRSRKLAREAIEGAADPDYREFDRGVMIGMAIAHSLLELAFQIGRLTDQVPVYGPPDEK
jgi:hypothetical protein